MPTQLELKLSNALLLSFPIKCKLLFFTIGLTVSPSHWELTASLIKTFFNFHDVFTADGKFRPDGVSHTDTV